MKTRKEKRQEARDQNIKQSDYTQEQWELELLKQGFPYFRCCYCSTQFSKPHNAYFVKPFHRGDEGLGCFTCFAMVEYRYDEDYCECCAEYDPTSPKFAEEAYGDSY